jgi:thiamine monophosphate kinase
MNSLVVSVCVFLVLTMGGIAIYAAATSGRHLIDARLSQVAVRGRVAAAGMPLVSGDGQVTRTLLKWAVGRLPKSKTITRRSAKVGELMVQAGYKSPNAVAIFQLSKVLQPWPD